MPIAIALLAGSAIVAFIAPRFLHRLGSAGFDPVVVTVGWLVAIAGVLGTAAAALIVMTVPHQTYGHRLGSLIDSAWWALTRDAPELLAYQGSRILAGVALVAGTLWMAVVRERRRRS